jgi:preprotein translocase SecF subunit
MWPLIKLLPQKTNFRFVALAPVLGALSLLACIASLYLTVTPFKPPCGGLNCGVDFTGGTVIGFATPGRPIDLAQVRETVDALGVGEVKPQGFADRNDEAQVKFQTPEGADPDVTATRVSNRLRQVYPNIEFRKREIIGPQVSGELLGKGVAALLAAIALMLCYIWFRFGLTFGVGAIIALTHDVILTFGLFAVTGMEFTLVAIGSVLTIIGYSINDKVVVLDRIRENLRKYKRMEMGPLIDLSINETLSRTIITGVTGIMALAVMAFYGGEALFAFAVSMIFGIVIGTYSSIYVAAPAMRFLYSREKEGRRREAAAAGDEAVGMGE